ncbi:hypothetical protein AK830_g72 [Neonectria ditissima]|uniref:Uncharacterized protein n=1 Tax=Neonectria ditissima TaxID=78410 RepID=A0A0P7BM83_9HYPO|nr:hypothetical protein AK830_g72 [Neonectria ditissima]
MQDRLGRTPLMLATFKGPDRVNTVLQGIRMANGGGRAEQIDLTEKGPVNIPRLKPSKFNFSQVCGDLRLTSFYAGLKVGRGLEKSAQKKPRDRAMPSESEPRDINPGFEHVSGPEDDQESESETLSSNEEPSELEDKQDSGAQYPARRSLRQMLSTRSRLGKDEWEVWSDNESIFGEATTKKPSPMPQELPASAEG